MSGSHVLLLGLHLYRTLVRLLVFAAIGQGRDNRGETHLSLSPIKVVALPYSFLLLLGWHRILSLSSDVAKQVSRPGLLRPGGTPFAALGTRAIEGSDGRVPSSGTTHTLADECGKSR